MTRDSVARGPTFLVARMATGDDRALGELYDAYGHVAYALAFAIIGAQSAAEVVVSQAFAEAWRSASSFESRTSVLAWLTSIVRRIALRVGRAAPLGAEKRHASAGVAQAGSQHVCPIADALQSLTVTQRRAIELSYYRGLTVGEIAAQLGQPESSARELLRTAMHELRSSLGPCDAVFDEHVVTRV